MSTTFTFRVPILCWGAYEQDVIELGDYMLTFYGCILSSLR